MQQLVAGRVAALRLSHCHSIASTTHRCTLNTSQLTGSRLVLAYLLLGISAMALGIAAVILILDQDIATTAILIAIAAVGRLALWITVRTADR